MICLVGSCIVKLSYMLTNSSSLYWLRTTKPSSFAWIFFAQSWQWTTNLLSCSFTNSMLNTSTWTIKRNILTWYLLYIWLNAKLCNNFVKTVEQYNSFFSSILRYLSVNNNCQSLNKFQHSQKWKYWQHVAKLTKRNKTLYQAPKLTKHLKAIDVK